MIFFFGEGVFFGNLKKIIYMVVSFSELIEVKRIVYEIDEKVFFLIINVYEVEG